jgi:DNA-binding NarL/FixJ family response regulator
MDVIKVCLVIPFEPLRLGIAQTIDEAADMKVIGQAGNLGEMVTLSAFREADVIVVDSSVMDGEAGQQTYAMINEWLPALKVLFLGTAQDARNLRPEELPIYMRLHTVGFILKDGPAARMLDAVRLVSAGTFVCETNLIRHILVRLWQAASYSSEAEPNGATLTDREMEVVQYVTRGMSNKEIAQEMFLSEGTVKAHVSHIMSKLGVERRTDLVRHALTSGLVRMEDDRAVALGQTSD